MQKFDTEKPWDSSWRAGMQDAAFWKREFEEPALLVITKSRSSGGLVEGDAPLAGGSLSAASASEGHHEPPPSAPKRNREARVEKATKTTHKVTDGAFTHNRANYKICPDFQSGQCTEVDRSGWCIKHAWSVHQCTKCLSDRHGAFHPNECGKTPGEPRGAGRKGKGKGKKGKRKR